MNTDIVNGLNDFYQKDMAGAETGQLVDLRQKVTDYNTLTEDIKGNISNQITTLTNKRDELLGLENEMIMITKKQKKMPIINIRKFWINQT